MNLYRDDYRDGLIKSRPNYNLKIIGDDVLLTRALAILHRMATERTGWRSFFRRWYFPDEPLRNDAANLVREAGFDMPRPMGTELVGNGERTLQPELASRIK
jgi:hypothetical protein